MATRVGAKNERVGRRTRPEDGSNWTPLPDGASFSEEPVGGSGSFVSNVADPDFTGASAGRKFQ